MAIGNRMYPRCHALLPLKGLDWEADDVKASALGDGYTYDPAHQSFADLTDVIDTVDVPDRAVSLTGEWSCGSLSPGPVIGGSDTMTRVVMWLDSGTPSTSWLLLYLDTNSDLTEILREGDGSAVTVPFPTALYVP